MFVGSIPLPHNLQHLTNTAVCRLWYSRRFEYRNNILDRSGGPYEMQFILERAKQRRCTSFGIWRVRVTPHVTCDKVRESTSVRREVLIHKTTAGNPITLLFVFKPDALNRVFGSSNGNDDPCFARDDECPSTTTPPNIMFDST